MTQPRVSSVELFGIDTSKISPALDFLAKKEFSSFDSFALELATSLRLDKICTMTGSGTDRDPFVLDFPYTETSQEDQTTDRETRENKYQKFKNALIQGVQKLRREGKTVPTDITVIQKIVRLPWSELGIAPIQTEKIEIIQIPE